jgi:predicted nucleotidyltransferase component of viral defense system
MNKTQMGARLIEFLQLAFLQVLPTRMPVADYVVKGGANLRLFYDSRRRSQDIDLDYLGAAFWKVEEKVDETLASRAFRDLLRLASVEMVDLTKPKQTGTTRRWKFAVAGTGTRTRLNSKIEFSSRKAADPEYAVESARSDIGRATGLRVVKANHYLATAAIRQKIQALAGRSETEPRDVFDLDLLFAGQPDAVKSGDVDRTLIAKAIDAAFAIPFEAFADLVVDYLEEEFVDIYNRPEVWDEMVTTVAGHLERLR